MEQNSDPPLLRRDVVPGLIKWDLIFEKPLAFTFYHVCLYEGCISPDINGKTFAHLHEMRRVVACELEMW